jgi:hemerythrin superfamily protein
MRRYRSSDYRNRGLGGGLTAFALGAGLSFLASRLLPPLAGRAIGTARVAMGADPFDSLARDHQRILGIIDALLSKSDKSRMSRKAGLLQIKRELTAHALAEEDVVYPLLRERAGEEEATTRLYQEHADMKMRLFKLEHMDADDPHWREELQGLRDLIAKHAQDEEQEEFPKLRSAMSRDDTSQLAGEVGREKQLVL